MSPVWSPDGTRIAFYRRAGAESGIYVVPALGGPEQKLHSVADLWHATISWSPDGKWIAFVDVAPDGNHTRIYLLSTETLTAKPIPGNPACFDEVDPAFSHNGQYLAYWCSGNPGASHIYFFSFPDGNPKMVSPSGTAFPNGLTWSADDTKLLYSHLKGLYLPYELDEVSVANGPVNRIGLEGTQPAVSPKGGKLAYNSYLARTNLWRRDLLHPEAPPVELIPSSRSEFDAQYSPDGKRIVFVSTRSGVQGVWIGNDDGSALVQISDPRSSLSGSPQWSPDGSKVVFDAFLQDRWEIYVADVAGGKPRKLTTNMSDMIRPSWSRDGKWIYFVSGRPGYEGVYRCPASGGDATALFRNVHVLDPQESFDGNTVYFAIEGPAATTLKKVALPGHPVTESEADPPLRVRYNQDWVVTPGGIYFLPAEAPRSVRYLEFSSRRIRTIFEVNRDLSSGLSVSPDGRWILYSQEADTTGDIMLVNDFH